MRRRTRPNLPAGYVIASGWDYGDFPDDVTPTYVLRQLRMVTVGHLWWKRTVPQLVEVMRNDSIEVLENAAWMAAGYEDAAASL